MKNRDQFPDARYRGKIYTSGPRGGKSSHCKTCNSDSTKKWAEKNKQRVAENARKRHLMTKFGITLDEYDEMLERQDQKCFICGCDAKSPRVKQKNFCVDHDHKTGDVRKILCDSCNLILGNADDDIELLKKCINYLEMHK
jgi:hypothetical protein